MVSRGHWGDSRLFPGRSADPLLFGNWLGARPDGLYDGPGVERAAVFMLAKAEAGYSTEWRPLCTGIGAFTDSATGSRQLYGTVSESEESSKSAVGSIISWTIHESRFDSDETYIHIRNIKNSICCQI